MLSYAAVQKKINTVIDKPFATNGTGFCGPEDQFDAFAARMSASVTWPGSGGSGARG